MHGRRIRILQVLYAFESGGAEQLVLELVRSLSALQYDFAVLAVSAGGRLEPQFYRLGCPVFTAGLSSRSGIPATILKMADFISFFRPDIVHTHLFAGDAWGTLATYLSGVTTGARARIMATEHSTNPDERPSQRWLRKQLDPWCDQHIAISATVAAYLRDQRKVPPHTIRQIANGIRFDRCSVPTLQRKGSRVLSIGRLVPAKGYDTLLDALSLAPALHLTLVGEGPLRQTLQKQAERLNIASRVDFVGYQKDIRPFFEVAGIYAQPSRFEGFGLAVVEAMASGLPVLVSRIGAFLELVEDRISGYIVDPESAPAWAAALKQLAEDDVARASLGARAAERARHCFSLETMVRGYKHAYDVLLTK